MLMIFVSVCELQTVVENMEYLSKAAFSTDNQLLKEVCKESVGVVLTKWSLCCSILNKDEAMLQIPILLVLYY